MLFFKRNYSKIFSNVEKCDIVFTNNNKIEQVGMFYQGKLHGYGFYINHARHTVKFGIFKNGRWYKNMNEIFFEIQRLCNPPHGTCWLTSKVFHHGVFLGESLSPASCCLIHTPPWTEDVENAKNSRAERYGIMIFKTGMFVGSFPPGFYMTRCVGQFYDRDFKVHTGTFILDVEVENKYTDDVFGDYFPPC